MVGRVVRAIDTSVLVRMATRDDERQARVAVECISNGVWVSQIVLAEAAWVLTALYGVSRAKLAKTIAQILDHVSIVVQDADVVRAALALYSGGAKVSFTDCLVLEMARRAGHLPLATFDRNLAKLDGVERVS